MSRTKILAAACAAVLALGNAARGEDWPQYRHDSARSGYTAERFAARLELDWEYRSPHAPDPAWPEQPERMPYDYCFQPVVSGDTVYFGSSADCKLYALDTATGAERWSFFTGAPIRVAPAVWNNSVIVASDDGFIYSIAGADGGEQWRHQAMPSARKILGNGRMISAWPARGGPVVHNDIVYYAAGLFPTQGCYVYALNVQDGRVIWCNDSSVEFKVAQPSGPVYVGPGAQGHLAVAGETLLVPTGRSVPAAFDLSDGRFLYFNPRNPIGFDFRTGHSFVLPVDGVFLTGRRAFDLRTDNSVCNDLGNQPESKGNYYGRCFESVLTPTMLFTATGTGLNAMDRSDPFPGGKVSTQWSAAVKSTGAVIAAGSKVVVGGLNTVARVDTDSHRVDWTAAVDGTAFGLAAANGRLFVSTDAGKLYSFAASGAGRIVQRPRAPNPYGDTSVYARAADEIIAKTGVKKGYCLDLGCGDGRLAYELAKKTDLQIICIDSDPAKTRAARLALDAAGLYGARVVCHTGDPGDTGYANYFANLIVSGRAVTEGDNAVPRAEIDRILRPWGGKSCIGPVGSMTVRVRGPLPGAGEWTHQYSNAGNTASSTDTIVRAPLGVLWFGGPGSEGSIDLWRRPPAPLFVEGRLYEEGIHFIRCSDAYNGRILWRKEMQGIGLHLHAGREYFEGTYAKGSNYCVDPTALYVHDTRQCIRLNGLTGDEEARFNPPNDRRGNAGVWGHLAHSEGLLIGSLAGSPKKTAFFIRRGRTSGTAPLSEDSAIFVMDSITGAMKWVYHAKGSVRRTSIAVGGGRVFFIERPQPAQATTDGKLVALRLDAPAPEVQWEKTDNVFGTVLLYSEEHDCIVMGFNSTQKAFWATDIGTELAVYRGSDGERLWNRAVDYTVRPVVVGRTVVAEPYGFDLLTGEPKMRTNPLSGEQEPWTCANLNRCGVYSASPNLLMYRTSTFTYFDLLNDEGMMNFGGIRPGCFINIIPAGGIVLMPQSWSGCICNLLHRTSIALEPIEGGPRWGVLMGDEPAIGRVGHVGINLGALGARRDHNGVMWLSMPYKKANRSWGYREQFLYERCITVTADRFYRGDSTRQNVVNSPWSWVAASGAEGDVRVSVNIGAMPKETTYRVALHFAEPDASLKAGDRVFDVQLNGTTVLPGFDVLKAAGGPYAAVVRAFTVTATGNITVQTLARNGKPILSGLEIEICQTRSTVDSLGLGPAPPGKTVYTDPRRTKHHQAGIQFAAGDLDTRVRPKRLRKETFE